MVDGSLPLAGSSV